MISMGLSSSPSKSTFTSPNRNPNTRRQANLSSTTTAIIRVPHRCCSNKFSSEKVELKSTTTQAVGLFPSVSPETVVVRDFVLEDFWEVADTHCSSFFPSYRFPWNFLLRINRFLGLVFGFSVPSGCNRTVLVAVTGSGRTHVTGILTLDTMADFLPMKGPTKSRRTGIAYISNVAVREAQRRKGIAKELVTEAEARALSWGCRAIALHCDSSDVAATSLYRSRGFKNIKVPDGANWPTPSASPLIVYTFMMKLLL